MACSSAVECSIRPPASKRINVVYDSSSRGVSRTVVEPQRKLSPSSHAKRFLRVVHHGTPSAARFRDVRYDVQRAFTIKGEIRVLFHSDAVGASECWEVGVSCDGTCERLDNTGSGEKCLTALDANVRAVPRPDSSDGTNHSMRFDVAAYRGLKQLYFQHRQRSTYKLLVGSIGAKGSLTRPSMTMTSLYLYVQ